MAPLKILLFSLIPKWINIARLPRALQRVGFEVGVACAEKSYLTATRFRDQTFLLPHRFCGKATLRQLLRIVDDWRPDLVLATDDQAVLFLARVDERIRTTPRAETGEFAALLRRSYGNPEMLLEATSKRRTLERARTLGLCVPESCVVDTTAAALDFAHRFDYPVVLKRSFGFGGGGVSICRDESALLHTWRQWRWRYQIKERLHTWCDLLCGQRAKSFWIQGDRSITINRYIPGVPAMCQIVAVEGRILGDAAVYKIQCAPDEKGPSSVVRFVAGGEMRQIAAALASAWKLTGFLSFDFVVDPAGRSRLIECNPRPIVLTHLSRLAGVDLCEVYHNHFAGLPAPAEQERRELDVALFPQEWRRDSSSPYLLSAYHDVPWEDPGLVYRLMQQ